MKTSLRTMRWIALGLPIIPALVIGGGLMLEASHIAFASPETLAEYHFGWEPMVAHGGWSYSSRWAYVASNAIWGVPLVALAGVLIWVLARRSESLAWLTAGSLAFLL